MLFEILVWVLAVPVGYLIAWLCRDELLAGRKWFKVLVVFGTVFGTGACLFGFWEIGWSLGFAAVVSFVSYLKSFDKKWTRKKV